MRLATLWTAIVVSLSGCASAQPAPVATARTFSLSGQAMTACIAPGSIGAKCGYLTVPENRSQPKGRQIKIKVQVLPAFETKGLLEPVFFVAGGPGGATIEDWSRAAITFPGLNQHHDIVLVDQRGTGGSHPLTFPPIQPGESPTDYASRAVASIDGDPRYYTTSVGMDDLDDVRQALGYKTIDLYGGSYGATAVQYYMRQHPSHVATAVLDGGTLLDVPLFELVALNSQRALDDVLQRCLADGPCSRAYPNIRAELATVLARLAHAPATAHDAAGAPYVITRDGFAGTLHSKLLSASDAAWIPWMIHRAWTGDFTDFLPQQSSGPDVLLVMSVEIRCSEAWARFDPDRVAVAGAGSYYLAAQLAGAREQAAACPLAPKGVVPPDDGSPPRSNAPVLLLNGTDDPQDPPSNVADAQVDMPHSVSLAVAGQGHTVGHLGCLAHVVVAFFDTHAVDVTAATACAAGIGTPAFLLPT